MPYYFLTVQVTPRGCDSFLENFVIKESLAKFISRNTSESKEEPDDLWTEELDEEDEEGIDGELVSSSLGYKMVITFFSEITRLQYSNLEPYNNKESYIKLEPD